MAEHNNDNSNDGIILYYRQLIEDLLDRIEALYEENGIPGGGGAEDVFWQNILGNPADNQALVDYIQSRFEYLIDPSPFVRVLGGQFNVDGRQFRFNGTNAYYLPNYQKAPPGGPGDPAMVDRFFSAAIEAQIKVIRMWAFYDGYDMPGTWSSVDPTENVIQTAPEVYDEGALEDLDLVIAKGKDLGLYFILPFINYWQELGGVPQYLYWDGNINPNEYDGPDKMQRFIDSANCQQWYRSYISMLLNRVNTVTGIAYKDEPAIMAWEIGNELRNPADGGSGTILRNWYREIAQYIKSIDSDHLVATGEEGFDENTPSQYTAENYVNTYVLRALEGTSFILNTAIPEIDFASSHWYPAVFGIGASVTPATLETQFYYNIDRYNIALSSGKPFVIGEYGLPDVTQGPKLESYQALYDMIEGSGIAGSLVWQLTADHHKANEFAGNINWPGGRPDLRVFLHYLNHSKNLNLTPATNAPVLQNGTLTVDNFTNNDIFLEFTPVIDSQFPQGSVYRMYVSESNNISTVEDAELNGTLKQELYVRGNVSVINMHAGQLAQDTLFYVNVIATNPAERKVIYNGTSQQTEFGDQVDPTLPGDTSVTMIDEFSTVIQMSFNEATDDVTPQGQLRYEIWLSETDNLGTDIPTVMANGTKFGEVIGANIVNAVGTKPNTNYFGRIIVFDSQNNGALYDAFNETTSTLFEYSIDIGNPLTSNLISFLPFKEGIGTNIMDTHAQEPSLIEGEGGQWDFVEGRKIWRKRMNFSEWITTAYREELLLSGGALTLANLVSLKQETEGLFYITYRGTAPGFTMSFPGWTTALRMQVGNLSKDFTGPLVALAKDGGLHMLVMTVDQSNNIGRLFVDGQLIDTFDLSAQGSSIERNWDVTSPIVDATGGYEIEYGLQALWSRALSPSEVTSFSNDPEQFLVEGAPIDINPPTISNGTLTPDTITDTSVKIDFTKATDDVSAQGDLVYRLYSSLEDNLSTLEDVIANGSSRAVSTDVATLTAVGLNPETPYYFQATVEDQTGNRSIYNGTNATTDEFVAPPVDPEIDPGNPMAANLIAYYQFHENTGNTVEDITGNGHNATANGGSWAIKGGSPCWHRATGQNHVLSIPDHNDLDIGDGEAFSIALRMCFDINNSLWNSLIYKGSNPGYSLDIAGWATDDIQVNLGSVSSNIEAMIEGDVETLHTVVLTIDNITTGIASLYVDGSLVGPVDLSAQANNGTNLLPIELPDGVADTNREYFYNKLGLWGRELTAQEVEDWNLNPDLMLLEA